MAIIRVGVDIAKPVFHVHGVNRHDQVPWRGKYSRGKWLDAIVKQVPSGAEIGMEACASSHYWARAAGSRLSRQANRGAVREALRQEQQE